MNKFIFIFVLFILSSGYFSQDGNLSCSADLSLEIGVMTSMTFDFSSDGNSDLFSFEKKTLKNTLGAHEKEGCVRSPSQAYMEEDSSGDFLGLTVTATPNDVCAGEEIQLFGNINEVLVEDNFDPGISWSYWCQNNGEATDVCGANSGNALYFDGNGIRECTTTAWDVSLGGNVSFFLKIASGTAPCDDAETGDGIVLEYSTSGCEGNYTVMASFLENEFPTFTQVVVPIPVGAQSANTHFRWRQLNNSGVGTDNWAIDDMVVTSFNAAGFSVSWTSTENITNPNNNSTFSTPTQSAYYYFEMVNTELDCIYLDSVFVQVSPAPQFTLPDDFSLCEPALINIEPIITSVGNYQYAWSADNGGLAVDSTNQNLSIEPTNTTTYTLEIAVDNSACSSSDEVTVFVNQISDISLTALDDTLCYGDSTLISLAFVGNPDSVSVNWSSTTDFSIVDQFHVYSSSMLSGTYTVEVVDDNSSCVFNSQIDVLVSDDYSIAAPADIGTCNAVGLNLVVSSIGVSENDLLWNWTPQVGLNNYSINNPVITDNVTQQYIVTASDQYNCMDVDTFFIQIIDGDLDFGPDVVLCVGDTLIIDTGYDEVTNSFLWNDGEVTPHHLITSAGTYGVVVSSALGCFTSDSIVVTYSELPLVNLPADFVACDGGEVELSTGEVDEVVLWNTGETDESIFIDEPGCFSVVLTNEYGCANSDTVCVEFIASPLVLLPDSVFYCDGDTVVVSAGNVPEYQYLWSTGATTSDITVSNSGNYSVLVTGTNNCETQKDVFAFFENIPEVVLPDDVVLCDGDTVVVNAQSNADYLLWNTGDTGGSLTVVLSGTYILSGYNQDCVGTDEMIILFDHPIEPTLPPDTVLCLSDFPSGFPLSSGFGGAEYMWSTGETTPDIKVFFPGFYRVEIKTALGCVSSKGVYIEDFCKDEQLFAPNAFTPDGDGVNDFFFVKGYHVADYFIRIFNRNGQVVWYSYDINDPWDGSFKNGEYYGEADTYSYVIDYSFVLDELGNRTELRVKKGSITVVR